MFMQQATAVRWLSAYFSWHFLSAGAIAYIGGLLRTLEAEPEGVVLIPVGVLLTVIGAKLLIPPSAQ